MAAFLCSPGTDVGIWPIHLHFPVRPAKATFCQCRLQEASCPVRLAIRMMYPWGAVRVFSVAQRAMIQGLVHWQMAGYYVPLDAPKVHKVWTLQAGVQSRALVSVLHSGERHARRKKRACNLQGKQLIAGLLAPYSAVSEPI